MTNIEQTAVLCGLDVGEIRRRVAARTFPLPTTCGGEFWDYGDLREWSRANGVTLLSSETMHETEVRGMLRVSPRRLYELVRLRQFPGPIGATKRWNADQVRDWISTYGLRRMLGVKRS